jgi:hypothetical protein
MTTVTVYRVDFYDIRNDAMQRSRRWFTRDGAKRVGGILVEATASVIDSSLLEGGEQWTARDFEPNQRKNEFQRYVPT